MSEEKLCVSGHPDAVVGQAMEEENVVAVRGVWMDHPRAEGDVVGSGDGGVGEFGVEGVGGIADCGDFLFGERAADGMECGVSQIDASDDRESQVEDKNYESGTGAAGVGHVSEELYARRREIVPGNRRVKP